MVTAVGIRVNKDPKLSKKSEWWWRQLKDKEVTKERVWL
jgi:hypothetical protein